MSKSKNHSFFSGFTAGFVAVVALVVAVEGVRYFMTSGAPRSPAAIDRNQIFDLSYLQGGALKSAASRQLLQEAQVASNHEVFGVSLGHFVTKGPNGEKSLLCDVYDQVQLHFEAEGMASNGDRPSLIVLAPCMVSENLNRTKPILVPIAELKNQSPADGDLTFGAYQEHVYRFSNMPSSWPTNWVLTEVKLVQKNNPGVFLELDRRDVYNYLKKPISMVW